MRARVQLACTTGCTTCYESARALCVVCACACAQIAERVASKPVIIFGVELEMPAGAGARDTHRTPLCDWGVGGEEACRELANGVLTCIPRQYRGGSPFIIPVLRPSFFFPG